MPSAPAAWTRCYQTCKSPPAPLPKSGFHRWPDPSLCGMWAGGSFVGTMRCRRRMFVLRKKRFEQFEQSKTMGNEEQLHGDQDK
jgi:hypothetical protein